MARPRVLLIEKCNECPHCSKNNYLYTAHCDLLSYYIPDFKEEKVVCENCPLPLSDW
jgi:hypothetical protein